MAKNTSSFLPSKLNEPVVTNYTRYHKELAKEPNPLDPVTKFLIFFYCPGSSRHGSVQGCVANIHSGAKVFPRQNFRLLLPRRHTFRVSKHLLFDKQKILD